MTPIAMGPELNLLVGILVVLLLILKNCNAKDDDARWRMMMRVLEQIRDGRS